MNIEASLGALAWLKLAERWIFVTGTPDSRGSFLKLLEVPWDTWVPPFIINGRPGSSVLPSISNPTARCAYPKRYLFQCAWWKSDRASRACLDMRCNIASHQYQLPWWNSNTSQVGTRRFCETLKSNYGEGLTFSRSRLSTTASFPSSVVVQVSLISRTRMVGQLGGFNWKVLKVQKTVSSSLIGIVVLL